MSDVRVSDVRVLALQTRYLLRATLRTPRLVVFSILLPVLLLVIFNSVFGGSSGTVTLSNGHPLAGEAYFSGAMVAYAVLLSCFTATMIGLTTERERGELKRYRGTPVPAWTFIVSVVLRSLVLVAAMTALMLAIAHLAYQVALPPACLAGIIVYVVLGALSLCTIGIAATALVDSVDTASSLGPFVAVILSLFSGNFIPVDQLPNWLEQVARAFPLFHFTEGLQLALAGPGSGLSAGRVAILLAWGIVALVIASLRFRWEPQGAGG